jgi:hypothetical protein
VGFVGAVSSILAALALVLASVGLSSVIEHSVSQRVQQIGMRMAMGGTGRDTARLVFAPGMRRIAIGWPSAYRSRLERRESCGRGWSSSHRGDPVSRLSPSSSCGL